MHYLLFGTDVSTNKRILSHPEDVGRLYFSFFLFSSCHHEALALRIPSIFPLLVHGFLSQRAVLPYTMVEMAMMIIVPPALHTAKMHENSRGGLTHT